MSVRTASFFLYVGLLTAADGTVATITASGPVKIGASEIPATAVSFFPLSLGDELSTMDAPAVARIGDLAVLKLESKTRLRLERTGDRILVRLLGGTLHYQVAPGANIGIYALDEPVNPSLAGTIKVDEARRLKHTIVAGAVGAVTVVTTVAVGKRSSNCPPSDTGNGCQK